MQLNENDIQKLDRLETEYAKYAVLFENKLPTEINQLRQTRDDITTLVNDFAPIVQDLQRNFSFGTQNDKNKIAAAQGYLSELEIYIKILSAKLPTFRPSI